MTEEQVFAALRKLAAKYGMCENALSRARVEYRRRVSLGEKFTEEILEMEIRKARRIKD